MKQQSNSVYLTQVAMSWNILVRLLNKIESIVQLVTRFNLELGIELAKVTYLASQLPRILNDLVSHFDDGNKAFLIYVYTREG